MTETTPTPDLDSAPAFPPDWSQAATDAAAEVMAARPDISGADLAALEQAGELITLADGLTAIAKEAGYMATGSTGQPVLHPAVAEASKARQAAATILTRLTRSASPSRKMQLQRARDERRRARRDFERGIADDLESLRHEMTCR